MKIQKKSLTAVLLALCLTLAALPSLAAEVKGQINVNTANAEQFSLLPRVGPSISKRIVEFRDANGPFKKIEDLMLVRGIGEKTFELMKPYLALSGETTLKEKVRSRKETTQQAAQQAEG